MRRACLTSSGMATRSWSMRSRTAACSRMTWLVIGTFLPLTMRASRRSTRNCMSTSPSRSDIKCNRCAHRSLLVDTLRASPAVSVPQEQQLLLTDLLDARDLDEGRYRGRMFGVRPRDDEPVRSHSRSKPFMIQGRFRNSDVGERRVAKDEVERSERPGVEVRDDVRHDDVRPCAEISRGEIAAGGLHPLRPPPADRRTRGPTPLRADPKSFLPPREVQDP